jgi:hypothetical protein
MSAEEGGSGGVAAAGRDGARRATKLRSPRDKEVSTRPLLEKLGVKDESKVSVVGDVDPAFLELMESKSVDFSTGRPRKNSDLVFFAANKTSDLARLDKLRTCIKSNGAIWVVRPKGVKEIREMDVIDAGKESGLVDNKVVAFSPTHTAERLVIPIAKR